ncbi:MAG: protocatechuate 3,4-dioxygenase, alpha subunit [Candidatus Eremiobacteraeota bacterium]|jgi:protocatechuate 3,4-dioxygenase alpha subunit|nr:protocatechuate 3,4-dioxygenase, alpha subunit [Candidatus Eremiobacteraeota bacterium]
MKLIPTASQTIGPFFREGLTRPAWSDLTRAGTNGTPVRIAGTVRDGDGAPVPDALLEIWQADERGRYAHPEDAPPVAGERLFRGFGRACTDPDGRYWFRTIVPGPVPGGAGPAQAPHVNVSLFARGLLKRVVTRIYLADHTEENARDPVLSSIPDEAARRSLIARREEHEGGVPVYRFDVILQGEGETAFFAI